MDSSSWTLDTGDLVSVLRYFIVFTLVFYGLTSSVILLSSINYLFFYDGSDFSLIGDGIGVFFSSNIDANLLLSFYFPPILFVPQIRFLFFQHLVGLRKMLFLLFNISKASATEGIINYSSLEAIYDIK